MSSIIKMSSIKTGATAPGKPSWLSLEQDVVRASVLVEETYKETDPLGVGF
jgi:hypothetical protein